jgi:hypothetical protein
VGQATSASQFFRQTGATVGAAVMGTLLGTTLGIAFSTIDLPPAVLAGDERTTEAMLSTGGAGLPDQIRSTYEDLAEGATSEVAAAQLRREGDRAAASVGAEIRAAFALANRRIYSLTALLLAVAAVLSLRIPEVPLRTTHDRAGGGARG